MKFMSILKTSFLILGNITTAYAGEYRTQNKSYIRIKKEIKRLDIPNTKEDRENLKSDRNAAVKDYKKAFEKQTY